MFDSAGRKVAIATFDDDPSFRSSVAALRESGRLPVGVEVLNVYQDTRQAARGRAGTRSATGMRERATAAGRNLGRRVREQISSLSHDDLTETGEDKHGPYRRRFTAAGEYYAFDRLDESGGVAYTNFFENRFLIRRDDMEDGFAARRTWFTSAGSANRVEFLTPEGLCFAQRWTDPEDGHGLGVYVVQPGTRTMRRFSGLPAWHADWLQSVVDRSDTPPYVIAETASTITKMLKLRRDSAVRLGMMHNSHLASPFAIDSPLRPDYEEPFANLDEVDAYVLLSERQRRDMTERLGHAETFTVVPNALVIPPEPAEQRDPHLVSIISRLAPQKALHEAVHAFAGVVEKVPEARLEIYGRGKERSALESLVSELGIQGNVEFMGRTDDANGVMARSVCTLSTSDWEALPLSIGESLAVATPVVAYDCLYGPSTLIRDGETGVLVPRGGRKELADAVVELLRSPERAARMGAAGRADISQRLSFEAVLRDWDRAFAYAETRSGLPASAR
ncbi:glycosyltransferase [Brachybacterium kimchii]|uniref:Glycosyltransferase n=1 Tax=Brachybacterium kimchii TaxID=2942909 RepID=A0ABY4N1S3_9MICO|nr:glycosyltransferase [Brachybacterium kimchii]UQN28066.1 glycosyltransferase [Brachybacterium kimchii]